MVNTFTYGYRSGKENTWKLVDNQPENKLTNCRDFPYNVNQHFKSFLQLETSMLFLAPTSVASKAYTGAIP